MEEILAMEHITKTYPGVKALDDVSISFIQGEVHAVMGENGAGKSTLMKILNGMIPADGGEIRFHGEKVAIRNPRDARALGIAMIHQELNPIKDLTVAENMFVGRYPQKGCFVDWSTMYDECRKLFEHWKVDFDPKQKVRTLSTAETQMLEILKAISYDAKLIIMDEPTVAVDPQSRNRILEGILELNRQGSTIIYTSHYMEEVEQICSRIAIIDHGHVLATGTCEELKNMIKTGETITIEAINLNPETLSEIRTMPNVFELTYEEQVLKIRLSGGKHNLISLLKYLGDHNISFGRVFSELPTLNDVFLEITGKELRD